MLFAEDLDDCVIAYELCGLERLRVVEEPSRWPPEGMREELPGRVANCLNIKGQDLVGESAAVSLLRQREGSCLDIATCAAHVKHLAMLSVISRKTATSLESTGKANIRREGPGSGSSSSHGWP
jgi:hypothetical protein